MRFSRCVCLVALVMAAAAKSTHANDNEDLNVRGYPYIVRRGNICPAKQYRPIPIFNPNNLPTGIRKDFRNTNGDRCICLATGIARCYPGGGDRIGSTTEYYTPPPLPTFGPPIPPPQFPPLPTFRPPRPFPRSCPFLPPCPPLTPFPRSRTFPPTPPTLRP